MFYSIVFIFFFSISNRKIVAQTCVYSSDPLVRCTTQGLIRGIRSDFFVNTSNLTTTSIESKSVFAFLGIPYGEAPNEEKRFRKPIPKRSWPRSFIYNATVLPNSCYQMIIDFFNTTGERMWAPFTPLSEDCLYLNIWTPITARQQQQPLAVMIWIYGGGFTSGSVCQFINKTNHLIIKKLFFCLEFFKCL
jgi:carboxylesterase type B